MKHENKKSLVMEQQIRMYATMPLLNGVPASVKCMESADAALDRKLSEVDEPLSLTDERGVGVVELILILIVLIALVAIFKTQLTSLVNTILSRIVNNANSIMR